VSGAAFSFRSREEALQKFRNQSFDLLVVGGGITGVAVARDAVSRGLSVALVERGDFASGTSSRSSKLVHGGLRYLESMKFGLVFESLAERSLLLKIMPNMVRPLPFYLPVYRNEPKSRPMWFLGLGLMLYDLLALFRSPEFHKTFGAYDLQKIIPGLKSENLAGGFKYYDASMCDDAITVETARSAATGGAAVANYVEAVAPLWHGENIGGFRVRDLEKKIGEGDIEIRAAKTVVCAGPWTDGIGRKLSGSWKSWLAPSRGVHLVFDIKKIPVPGAVVMIHPDDGRISFVMPRRDLGEGVVIVGTTDASAPEDPGQVRVEKSDVDYLMGLLGRYFPKLDVRHTDIISAYAGVRPLVGPGAFGKPGRLSLQQVSREHHIGRGPGGTVVVAGGKFTTHRKMAEQIVDFTLSDWSQDAKAGRCRQLPQDVRASRTKEPLNFRVTAESLGACQDVAAQRGTKIPGELLSLFGAEAVDILEINAASGISEYSKQPVADPPAFPFLAAQLRHQIRSGMVMHLDDFYFRRTALFLSRPDHGLPWSGLLSRVWAEERGLDERAAMVERDRLEMLIEREKL